MNLECESFNYDETVKMFYDNQEDKIKSNEKPKNLTQIFPINEKNTNDKMKICK